MIENIIFVFNCALMIAFAIVCLSIIAYFIGFHLSKGWYRGRNLIEEETPKINQ